MAEVGSVFGLAVHRISLCHPCKQGSVRNKSNDVCTVRFFFARCSEVKVFSLTVNLMVRCLSVKFISFES